MSARGALTTCSGHVPGFARLAMRLLNRILPRVTFVTLSTLFIAVATPAGAQSYYFLRFTGATVVPGTTDTGNHCDDCVTAVAVPFPVNLYGTSFNTANVSSNGNLQFATNNIGFAQIPLPAPGFTSAIF